MSEINTVIPITLAEKETMKELIKIKNIIDAKEKKRIEDKKIKWMNWMQEII